MSVHGPDSGRRKPWRAAWRDGRQRTMRFATEAEAIAKLREKYERETPPRPDL